MRTKLTRNTNLDFLQGRHQPKHTYKIALYAPEADLNGMESYDSSGEVAGQGYVTGGQTLGDMAFGSDDLRAWATFKGPTTWYSSTIEARWAVIYNNTQPDKPIVAIFDMGTQRSVNGNFEITFPDEFIILQ
jgi:hypothetical protein